MHYGMALSCIIPSKLSFSLKELGLGEREAIWLDGSYSACETKILLLKNLIFFGRKTDFLAVKKVTQIGIETKSLA